ncbi:sporulation-specific diadenylate cyclase CdaS [Niallia nealsonii]|nr:sporulation-specific diadenylate cyclase CdaS [Niallia nealsonii]
MEISKVELPEAIRDMLKIQVNQLLERMLALEKMIEESSCCILNDFEEINVIFGIIHATAASHYLKTYLRTFTNEVDILTVAVQHLSNRRHGALIAIKRQANVEAFIHSGVPIYAKLSYSLIEAIFYNGNPLHDGGVLIDQNTIVSAGNIFPTSKQYRGEQKLGTRHRAAIGLSEQTDALVLVVSEETGRISFAVNGKLYPVHPHGLV